jgi:hypothetical protein
LASSERMHACVERGNLIVPFPCQPTTGDHIAGEMRPLHARGTRVIALDPVRVLTSPRDVIALRAAPITSADLHGRGCQVSGCHGWDAASGTHLYRPHQPTALRPVGKTPIAPQRWVGKTANLLEPKAYTPLQIRWCRALDRDPASTMCEASARRCEGPARMCRTCPPAS